MIPSIYAEENPPKAQYAVSISALTGFLNGQGREISYKNGAGDYLSLLVWNMEPLYYYGYAFNFERANPLEGAGFYTNLTVRRGIADNTGTMSDMDWHDKRDMRLTNFSSHDNRTDSALMFDFKAGASFPLFGAVVIKTYAIFSFMDFSWKSTGGYLQYAQNYGGDIYDAWNESLPKTYLTGRVVDYHQTWFLGGLGFSATLPIGPFSMGLGMDISPLVFCMTADNHWLRDMRFEDYFMGGILFEPSAFALADLGRRLTLKFRVSYRVSTELIGDSYIYNTYGGAKSFLELSRSSAGTSFTALDVSFSLSVKFF